VFKPDGLSSLHTILADLSAKLELHAGNYPMLNLQQLATGLIKPESISQRVFATVISYYPKRGANGSNESMIDAEGLPGPGNMVCTIAPESISQLLGGPRAWDETG